jgi:[acyl-carrier-protein] S-malonyltransferase
MAEETVVQHCLCGPLEVLSQTHIAQPALFAYSLALTAYARQIGLVPDFVAGHSLGEYTAAVSVGVLSFAEGLRLVCQRGRLMHRIQQERPGAMAAVIGLTADALHNVCFTLSHDDVLSVTNWNAPAQFVVSGDVAGIERLIEHVRQQPGARALRLPVGGAFHSSLMAPVQSALAEIAQSLDWHDAQVPVAANVSGSLLTARQHIQQELVEQITSPVQWVLCIESLLRAGCSTFVEIGSGQVLSKLMRLIAPEARTYAADTPEKIADFASSLSVA